MPTHRTRQIEKLSEWAWELVRDFPVLAVVYRSRFAPEDPHFVPSFELELARIPAAPSHKIIHHKVLRSEGEVFTEISGNPEPLLRFYRLAAACSGLLKPDDRFVHAPGGHIEFLRGRPMSEAPGKAAYWVWHLSKSVAPTLMQTPHAEDEKTVVGDLYRFENAADATVEALACLAKSGSAKKPEPRPLNERQECYLLALLKLGAFDEQAARTAELVEQNAEGDPDGNTSSDKARGMLRRLKGRGLVDSAPTSNGGWWLTAKGREEAESLQGKPAG